MEGARAEKDKEMSEIRLGEYQSRYGLVMVCPVCKTEYNTNYEVHTCPTEIEPKVTYRCTSSVCGPEQRDKCVVTNRMSWRGPPSGCLHELSRAEWELVKERKNGQP